MRLLDTTTLEMEEYMGKPPPYAILSHTWEGGEVSYQDITMRRAEAQGQKGFAKVEQTCRLARQEGIEYAWIDTCCIDKTSCAELSEAINSMFAWYAASDVCFVYLSDLAPEYSVSNQDDTTEAIPVARLQDCKWFTRGWTLQELIAPRSVPFYDSPWAMRGTKATLSSSLSLITGIEETVMSDPSLVSTLSVAVRMGWASKRKTTRLEDMAYCLLGIFDKNMPLLYGEGEKAFIRLQEEIAGRSPDMTLLAWTARDHGESTETRQLYRGVFAQSPAEFESAKLIVAFGAFR
jgi:hypothetical protein